MTEEIRENVGVPPKTFISICSKRCMRAIKRKINSNQRWVYFSKSTHFYMILFYFIVLAMPKSKKPQLIDT
jgi:bacteriorhodopsin